MRLFIITLFFLSVCVQYVIAQVIPEPGIRLNYRLIGFSFPQYKKSTSHILQVEEYYIKNDGGIVATPVHEQQYFTNQAIVTVPYFGRKYRWRVQHVKKGAVVNTTPYYEFEVMDNPFSGENITRVKIIDSASRYKSMLVFFDNTRTLYNIHGEPLWFLPAIDGVTDNMITGIRDMKVTPQGTITFLTNDNAYEIDYNGTVLWKGPDNGLVSGDTTEHYHHQFDKLPDGNYMVAGIKFIMRKIPGYVDTNVYKGRSAQDRSDGRYTNIGCGTVIEYNHEGKLIWSWNSCDYMEDADFFTPVDDGNIRPSTHLNGFYIDKNRGVLYTSYRDISRVIKAAYPSGKVLAQYGQDFTHDDRVIGDGLFYSLHNCRLDKNGDLYLFNNNHRSRRAGNDDPGRASTVIVLKEPQTNSGDIHKLWEFSCDIDTLAKPLSVGGGSVEELPGGDYLVCMGASHRNFIVSKDKKILWNALVEIKTPEGAWMPSPGYRISPVLPEYIERMVFSGSPGK